MVKREEGGGKREESGADAKLRFQVCYVFDDVAVAAEDFEGGAVRGLDVRRGEDAAGSEKVELVTVLLEDGVVGEDPPVEDEVTVFDGAFEEAHFGDSIEAVAEEAVIPAEHAVEVVGPARPEPAEGDGARRDADGRPEDVATIGHEEADDGEAGATGDELAGVFPDGPVGFVLAFDDDLRFVRGTHEAALCGTVVVVTTGNPL
jgi:hypothetical protein